MKYMSGIVYSQVLTFLRNRKTTLCFRTKRNKPRNQMLPSYVALHLNLTTLRLGLRKNSDAGPIVSKVSFVIL